MKARKSYAEWMVAVDAACMKLAFGLGIDDLPDMAYNAMFEDGLSPAAAARKAIRSARGEDE